MKKPVAPPIDGAWRITEFALTGASGWVANNRWLYDSDKSYKAQYKSKITSALTWSSHGWTQDNTRRFTIEQFDGKQWVQIEAWIGPTEEQRRLKGLRKRT